VKKYYFEKEAQVQQLQNTVAHQRMSTSRTVLDDNEYATRFGRLDGAINNLAFNIRKDWKSIPPWLQGVVNEDAHTVGTKEMTAIGRACLTRWLVDEIFDRFFHPDLEPNLSRQLKMIERTVRRQGKVSSEEDRENHLARLSLWRRTTLDGLAEVLQSRLAEDNRAQLTKNLVDKLTASLEMNLKAPSPPGLQNGVSMIIELAIGIVANMPLESRDVSVEYFLPGAPILDSYMKIEMALPPLANPGLDARHISEPTSATDRPDHAFFKGTDAATQNESSMVDPENPRDSSSSSTTHSGLAGTGSGTQAQHQYQTGLLSKEPKKKSVFGSLISKKPHPSAAANAAQSESARPGSAIPRDSKDREEAEHREKEAENRIRFAAFVAVEVRAKGTGNVIVRAPVYGFV
jgi:hypothetical protein